MSVSLVLVSLYQLPAADRGHPTTPPRARGFHEVVIARHQPVLGVKSHGTVRGDTLGLGGSRLM